jgi:transcriptional regulator with XRE-family HTH domain
MTQAPNPITLSDGPPAVGTRLQALRKAQDLSLDDLSRRSGVSKSMLSEVERNRSNPTIAVLWRLASALGISLTDFLAEKASENSPPALTLVAAQATPVIRSNDGKCELRILGPIALAGKLEWYELTIEPGGELASDAHEEGAKEHLSVQNGSLLVQVGGNGQQVRRGETARYVADVQHSISNTGKTAAKAILVVEYSSGA